jgi:hypothetical protein
MKITVTRSWKVPDLSKLLLCALIFVLPDVNAETDVTQDEVDTSSPEQYVDKERSDAVRPVEAGPGGGLKLESKKRGEAESLFEWHAHMLWESRYVTEGRDNLSGAGLVSISSEFNVGETISVVPWFADSPGADYREFNLSFVGGTRLTDDILLYAGYTWLYARAQDESANDDEVSLSLVYEWTENLSAAAVVYHSFNASGTFIETTVRYGASISQTVDYSLQAILGANDGYIIDGHDGLNHFQLRANVEYEPVKNVQLYALAGYTRAINRDAYNYAEDETLGNFVWGGIGFIYLF